MKKCNCVFAVMDFDKDGYQLGDMVCDLAYQHEGPHIDNTKNYTWGPVTGFDLYRVKQQTQDTVKAHKRKHSLKEFLRKKNGN